MKKVILLCLTLLCLSVVSVLATDIYVENYSFEEPGDGKIKGWDMDDGAYYVDSGDPAEVPGWESDGTVVDSGVEEGGKGWMGSSDGDWNGFLMSGDPSVYQLINSVITVGTVYELVVDAQLWGDGFTMSIYYDDAGTRVPVVSEQFMGDGEGDYIEYTLSFAADDVPASQGKQIGIEMINDVGGWIQIDNVRLSTELELISLVSPAVGAKDVGADDNLYWDLVDPNITDFDVYFYASDDSEPNLLRDYRTLGTQLEFVDLGDNHFMAEPGTMDLDIDGVMHYWIVDAIEVVDGPGSGTQEIVYPGGVWYFSTMPTGVQITQQPQSQTIPASGNVQFTVEATSPTPINYSWRKEGLIDELSTSDTLTIYNIQAGDEGYYYCILSNDVSTEQSANARLMTERLVGWWKLDSNVVDSVNLEVPGVPAHNGILPADPNFITGGIDNDAYEFFGDARIIEIAESAEYFNFYPQGYTISAWVKNPNEGWGGIVGKQNEARTPDYGWVLNHNGNTAHSTLRQTANSDYGADVGLLDGQWHLLTGMFDSEIGQVKLYVDGDIVATSEEGITGILGSATNMVIGAESTDGASPMSGIVDDVKLWSYPLDSVEVAMEYIKFNPDEKICVNQDDPWMEFNVVGEPGEPSWCRIDLEDIAELASVWMNCNLVPSCIPLP